MSKPNFYASIETLNVILKMEYENERCTAGLTLDLIDFPLWFSYEPDEKNPSFNAYQQSELYNKNESLAIKKGSVEHDVESGMSKVGATPDLENYVPVFFSACQKLSGWVAQTIPEDVYADLDPESSGILLTAQDDEIKWEVVTGKDRPDLVVQTLFGGVTTARPYMDDFWERSARDEMDEEELTDAANDGDEDAMNELAMAYLSGDEDRGIEQNFEKSAYWWEKLAETGNAVGMFNTGLHYGKGCGVKRDFAKAAEWMKKAEQAGDPDAAGPAKTYREAEENEKKAKAGDPKAMAAFAGTLMALGGSLEQMGPGEDYKESLEWARKAEEAGCADACWPLALAYEHGRGVECDQKKATEFFRKGAEGGNAECQHSYGCRLIQGDGVKKDVKMAFELFERSAEQGYALALRDLGRMYETGEFVEPDFDKELEYYEKACLAYPTDAEFMRHVGYQYINLLDAEDEETWLRGVEGAARWLRKAADLGDYVAEHGASEYEKYLELYKEGILPAGTPMVDCMKYLAESEGEDEDDGEENEDGAEDDVSFDITEEIRRKLTAAGIDSSDEAIANLSVDEMLDLLNGDL